MQNTVLDKISISSSKKEIEIRPAGVMKYAKKYAQSMHRACTEYAQSMHRACTEYAQSIHRACTEHAQSMHRVCTEYAQSMHRVCTCLNTVVNILVALFFFGEGW